MAFSVLVAVMLTALLYTVPALSTRRAAVGGIANGRATGRRGDGDGSRAW